MANFQIPVAYKGLSSWSAHQRRVPKSSEPGTDLYCPIGTPVYAPETGLIYGYGTSIVPATGRWVGINFTNGMSWRALHLSRLVKTSGFVRRGDLIGYSGATGYGKEDWSKDPDKGGAHVHVTLWPTTDRRFGYDRNGKPYTIDFMEHVGGSAAGGGTTKPKPPEEDEMYLITWNGRAWLISDEKVAYVRNDGASLQMAKMLSKQSQATDVSNDQLTELLFLTAIPWAALDATYKGQAFDNESNWGHGTVWSRQIAEGREDMLRDASLAKSISDLEKSVTG